MPSISARGDTPLPGAYVARWLKRGPSGFIGTNKLCSRQTVTALLDDAGWKRIDRAECRLGADLGRPRRRLSNWQDLLHAAV
jgi:ferredoxin--NADP+ reductase